MAKWFLYLLIVLFIGALFFAVLNGRNYKKQNFREPKDKSYTQLNISYGSHPLQKLDIFSDQSLDKAPTVILVHGGGWVDGDKDDITPKYKNFFRDLGFVVVSTNYRLSTKDREFTFPVPINDVGCAAAWVKKNIQRFAGDPDKIFIMGHSAGAHISAMLALDQKTNWLTDCDVIDAKLSFRGFWGDSGAYDWELTPDHWQIGVFLDDLNSPDKWNKTEPINFSTPDDPPTLLTAGNEDFFANFQNSIALADTLKKANVQVTLHVYTGFDHTGFQSNFRKGDKQLQNDVKEFFLPLTK